jgi:membrane protein implicated in regulation of membrane protease activity
MTGSPLDPLEHMLIAAAIALGAAALATVSMVMFLRWLGLHWTWTLPGVLLWPLLWSFDEQAAVFAAGTALFATVTGARWHRDDLRHGGDQAQRARDRRTPFDATRARIERRGVRGGRWVDRRADRYTLDGFCYRPVVSRGTRG